MCLPGLLACVLLELRLVMLRVSRLPFAFQLPQGLPGPAGLAAASQSPFFVARIAFGSTPPSARLARTASSCC